jgi:hypothetical protein
MINLTEMQKAAEFGYYDQCEPENILKLIDVARAAKRAWELLNVIRPRSPETDNLFRALEGIEL